MFFYIVNSSVYIILWLCNFILLFIKHENADNID